MKYFGNYALSDSSQAWTEILIFLCLSQFRRSKYIFHGNYIKFSYLLLCSSTQKNFAIHATQPPSLQFCSQLFGYADRGHVTCSWYSKPPGAARPLEVQHFLLLS